MSFSHNVTEKMLLPTKSKPLKNPITQRNKILIDQFQLISGCVQDFIKLSVTGLPPEGGRWMEKKSSLFASYAHEWNQGTVPCFQGYLGFPIPKDFSPDKSKMVRTNLARLKNTFINATGTGREFSFESCTEEEIVNYLNRCRVSRYGDCDVHALETAMLLIYFGIADADHVHIINDQKWGHTFVRISKHLKCPFACVIDPWSDHIASTPISLKKFTSTEKLSNGSPTLKHELLAEQFIRNPNNIKNYTNVLMVEEYNKKILECVAADKPREEGFGMNRQHTLMTEKNNSAASVSVSETSETLFSYKEKQDDDISSRVTCSETLS